MEFGVLGVEMESTALYTLAAKYGVKALSILTVGSQLLTNESLTHEESEKSFLIWWTLLYTQLSRSKGWEEKAFENIVRNGGTTCIISFR